MTIPVTARSGKGSALTHGEMDTNWTNLARSATTSVEGSVTLADQTVTNALTSTDHVITPSTLQGGVTSMMPTSANSNGYCRLPSGILLQWGVCTFTGSPTLDVTFTTNFTYVCYNVQLTNYENYAFEGNISRVRTISNTGFRVVNGGGNDYTAYFWFAIGV